MPEQATAVVRAWRDLGFATDPRIVLDVVGIYAAGTVAPRGVVLAAGTGAVAALVDDGELVRRTSGRGYLVGDEGSAVWLGIEGVRAALLALDGRGPRTILSESVPEALGVSTRDDVATAITDAVYGRPPADLGRLAPVVVAATGTGDAVATSLIEDGARHLGDSALAAAGDETPEVVVLGGSLLTRVRPIRERVRTVLAERWPDASMEQADSGEAGATALALRLAGIGVTSAILSRLRSEGRHPD